MNMHMNTNMSTNQYHAGPSSMHPRIGDGVSVIPNSIFAASTAATSAVATISASGPAVGGRGRQEGTKTGKGKGKGGGRGRGRTTAKKTSHKDKENDKAKGGREAGPGTGTRQEAERESIEGPGGAGGAKEDMSFITLTKARIRNRRGSISNTARATKSQAEYIQKMKRKSEQAHYHLQSLRKQKSMALQKYQQQRSTTEGGGFRGNTVNKTIGVSDVSGSEGLGADSEGK